MFCFVCFVCFVLFVLFSLFVLFALFCLFCSFCCLVLGFVCPGLFLLFWFTTKQTVAHSKQNKTKHKLKKAGLGVALESRSPGENALGVGCSADAPRPAHSRGSRCQQPWAQGARHRKLHHLKLLRRIRCPFRLLFLPRRFLPLIPNFQNKATKSAN